MIAIHIPLIASINPTLPPQNVRTKNGTLMMLLKEKEEEVSDVTRNCTRPLCLAVYRLHKLQNQPRQIFTCVNGGAVDAGKADGCDRVLIG